MKGLLLAGGHGTRLRPLTFSGNKHMIPIANQPILFYGLRHLQAAGVREVGLVLGPIEEGIVEAVGDGSRFGLQVTYIRQGEPKGLAHAVLCGREFLGEEPFVMYLGDNLLEHGIAPFLAAYRARAPAAVIGVASVANPQKFGVVELDSKGAIASIEEKPAAPRSDLALVGVYLFSPAIHEAIAGLRPSARGELEITDAIRALHARGASVVVERVNGWWKDTGQPSDLLEANERVLRSMPPDGVAHAGCVEEGARISGTVGLEAGTVVERGAVITGPCVLGRNCRVGRGSRIGPYVALGDGVRVEGAALSRSIVLANSRLAGAMELRDCLIGRDTSIVATSKRKRAISLVLGDSCRASL